VKVELIAPKEASEFGGRLGPKLGLLTVAGLTSPDIEVSLTDENIEDIDFDKDVDLVGILAMTPTAGRAYRIAEAFRKRGKHVVLGGLHPSALPEEAIQYADAVVIGEAEGIWPGLLSDLRAGKLKRFYRRNAFVNLQELKSPRRDLIKPDAYYVSNVIETSRGCPFQCSFCSVSLFFGKTYRFRPINAVVNEVERFKGPYFAIVDDNIAGHRRRAIELFRALVPHKRKWIGQATTAFALDEGLVNSAAKAGCAVLFIGYESLSTDSLNEVGKTINIVERYREGIKRMHDSGICVHGSFLFGFDNDDESVFERTVTFINEAKVDSASLTILTPNPGTPLYRKLLAEGRIINNDWWKSGRGEATWRPPIVFRPKRMSPEALFEGWRRAVKECYSSRSILKRMKTPGRDWFLRLKINLGFKAWAKTV
jgi:radical SAM superfamily enzyme YgiQ (UPF0313 family)